MKICRSCWLLLPALLFFGCGGNAAWPPVPLSGEDLASAHAGLRDHFTGIHDHEFEVPAELRGRIDAALSPLAEQLDPAPELSVLLVNNPDADAGCIAGGQIFLSLGLLAFTEHADELAGALALALTACGDASEDWRRRERSRLPEIDTRDPLMVFYRDLRLREQASLYNQLVRKGCGRGRNCQGQAREWLAGADVGADGLGRLLARIGDSWPDAAVLHRFGGAAAPGGTVVDGDFRALVAPFAEQRVMLGHLRDARWELLTGEVIEAYRANLRASIIESDSWLPLLMEARVDLVNVHPEYTLRKLGQLQDVYSDRASIQLYEGIARWQMGQVTQARELLEASLESRPTVSGHYYLGRLIAPFGERELAVKHLRVAIDAGAIHPYSEDAAARLTELEAGESPRSRR